MDSNHSLKKKDLDKKKKLKNNTNDKLKNKIAELEEKLDYYKNLRSNDILWCTYD